LWNSTARLSAELGCLGSRGGGAQAAARPRARPPGACGVGAGHRTAAPGRASRALRPSDSRRRSRGPHRRPGRRAPRGRGPSMPPAGALRLREAGAAPVTVVGGLGMPELPVCRRPDRRSTRPGPGGQGGSSGGALHFGPLVPARQRGARDDGRREAQAGHGVRSARRPVCRSYA
jgi:hypothetical protein